MLRPLRLALMAAVLSTSLATGQPRASEARARASEALQSRVKEEKYLIHSLRVEAMLRSMAVAKNADADEWGLAGLLHDIDLPATANQPSKHGIVGAQILRNLGFSSEVVQAVKAHDDRAGVSRTSRLDFALYCADQAYWLFMAVRVSGSSDARTPETLWEQAQVIPAKKPVVEKVSQKCAGIGFSGPQLLATARAAVQHIPQMPR